MSECKILHRSSRMPATTAATTSSAPTMYLLAANHDCDGCSPALRTSSGDEAFAGLGSAFAIVPAGEVLAGAGRGIAGAAVGFAGMPGPAKLLDSFGFAAACADFASGSRAGATAAAAPPEPGCPISRVLCEMWGFAGSANGDADGGGVRRSWPRHRFSSHSTQYSRPGETGNPHAAHCFR
jgi:hypothetical protein